MRKKTVIEKCWAHSKFSTEKIAMAIVLKSDRLHIPCSNGICRIIPGRDLFIASFVQEHPEEWLEMPSPEPTHFQPVGGWL